MRAPTSTSNRVIAPTSPAAASASGTLGPCQDVGSRVAVITVPPILRQQPDVSPTNSMVRAPSRSCAVSSRRCRRPMAQHWHRSAVPCRALSLGATELQWHAAPFRQRQTAGGLSRAGRRHRRVDGQTVQVTKHAGPAGSLILIGRSAPTVCDFELQQPPACQNSRGSGCQWWQPGVGFRGKFKRR